MKNFKINFSIALTALILLPSTIYSIYNQSPVLTSKPRSTTPPKDKTFEYLKPLKDSVVFPIMRHYDYKPTKYGAVIISPTSTKEFFGALKTAIKIFKKFPSRHLSLFPNPFIDFELDIYDLGIYEREYKELKENKIPERFGIFYDLLKSNTLKFEQTSFVRPSYNGPVLRHQRVKLYLFGEIGYEKYITGFMLPYKGKETFKDKFNSNINWVKLKFTKNADKNLEELKKVIKQILSYKVGENKSIVIPKVLFWNPKMKKDRWFEIDALCKYLPKFYFGKFEDVLYPGEEELN